MHFDRFAALVFNTSGPLILVEGRKTSPRNLAHGDVIR